MEHNLRRRRSPRSHQRTRAPMRDSAYAYTSASTCTPLRRTPSLHHGRTHICIHLAAHPPSPEPRPRPVLPPRSVLDLARRTSAHNSQVSYDCWQTPILAHAVHAHHRISPPARRPTCSSLRPFCARLSCSQPSLPGSAARRPAIRLLECLHGMI